MNKYIVINDKERTYNILKEDELFERYGEVKFHRTKDLINGAYNISYYNFSITICNTLTNKGLKRFKKILNIIKYVYKYEY